MVEAVAILGRGDLRHLINGLEMLRGDYAIKAYDAEDPELREVLMTAETEVRGLRIRMERILRRHFV